MHDLPQPLKTWLSKAEAAYAAGYICEHERGQFLLRCVDQINANWKKLDAWSVTRTGDNPLGDGVTFAHLGYCRDKIEELRESQRQRLRKAVTEAEVAAIIRPHLRLVQAADSLPMLVERRA